MQDSSGIDSFKSIQTNILPQPFLYLLAPQPICLPAIWNYLLNLMSQATALSLIFSSLHLPQFFAWPAPTHPLYLFLSMTSSLTSLNCYVSSPSVCEAGLLLYQLFTSLGKTRSSGIVCQFEFLFIFLPATSHFFLFCPPATPNL